jgi:hypothetical protein
MWSAAASISVGLATNRVPLTSCNSCYRHEAFRQFACYPMSTTNRGKPDLPEGVEKAYVGWGETPDAPLSSVEEYHHTKAKVLSLGGWTQSFYSFADHWDNVCWALQPRLEVQKQAQAYFDSILTSSGVAFSEHTKVVTVHLRRGDYVGKADIHGLLSVVRCFPSMFSTIPKLPGTVLNYCTQRPQKGVCFVTCHVPSVFYWLTSRCHSTRLLN